MAGIELNIRKNAGRPDYTFDLCYCWLSPWCKLQTVHIPSCGRDAQYADDYIHPFGGVDT